MPRSSSRRRSHFKMHTNQLDEHEITHFEGFQITTIERTIMDVLASHADLDQVRMAIQQAIANGLTTRDKLITQARKRSKSMQNEIERLLAHEV